MWGREVSGSHRTGEMEYTEMGIGLTIIAIGIGVVLIIMVGISMKKKQISDYQGILWLIAAILIIILGAFPRIVHALADLLGIWWAPSVLLFSGTVLIGFIVFNHSKEISILKSQMAELSMQISILKAEKEDPEGENSQTIQEEKDTVA